MCKSNLQLAMCSSSQRVEERKLCLNDMEIIEYGYGLKPIYIANFSDEIRLPAKLLFVGFRSRL